MDWIPPLLGALLGAAAAFGGTAYAEWRTESRRREDKRRDRIRAARAWRDDFYALQTRLGTYALTAPRKWVESPDTQWHPMGSDADLLLLSPLYDDGEKWGGLGSGRRQMLMVVDRWRRDLDLSTKEIKKAYGWMETAREQLAEVDDWTFKPHKCAAQINSL